MWTRIMLNYDQASDEVVARQPETTGLPRIDTGRAVPVPAGHAHSGSICGGRFWPSLHARASWASR